MNYSAPLLLSAIALTACNEDETVAAYAPAGTVWELRELDGLAFGARETITFPEEGRIEGQAPCNRYFATQTAPYPWFEVRGIGATKMACSDLAAEARFFAALERVTLAEVLGDVLILSDEGGFQMLFNALD